MGIHRTEVNKRYYENKFLGSMMGMAIGDALGAPFEMQNGFPYVEDMHPLISEKYKLNKPAGTWTDDTSMALCLAESLLVHDGQNAKDQLIRYNAWLKDGYMVCGGGEAFGSGSSTREAVKKFMDTGQVVADYNADKIGNGSVMRLAPLVLFYGLSANNEKEIAVQSFLSSLTTHSNPICGEACIAFGIILYRILRDKYKYGYLPNRLPEYNGVSRMDIFRPTDFQFTTMVGELFSPHKQLYFKKPNEIQGTGHAFKSLEAASWCFLTTTSYKDAVLKAVNLGDDADSTAAICGAMAGMYYGYDSIPKEWVNKLQDRIIVDNTARRLLGHYFRNYSVDWQIFKK